MAVQLNIVFDQIIIFSILMAIGFFAAKASLITIPLVSIVMSMM